MHEIVAGTTPTLVYNFSKVRPSDITSAVLTAKKRGTVVLEKDLTSATITEETISWTLTQEETLQLGTGAVEFMLNWVDNGAPKRTRGIGKVIDVRVVPNHINEVIT